VDLLADMECWEEGAFLEAMHHGLHGHKRENRYESAVDANIRKYIQSEAMDMFDVAICPHSSKAQFPDAKDPLDFLKEYLKGLWELYANIHDCANKFVSPLLMRHLAAPLYKRAECIMDSITRTKRKIDRYDMVAEHGTAMHDLYRQNTADESLHDDFESKEAEGVKYDY